MRKLIIGAAVALALTGTASAADYKLEFQPGQGKIQKGRGGLQVYDVRTDNTLMRVIAPGNRITKRGTVRVLVMNLGSTSYDFGPEQVSVELPDGTAFKEVPFTAFDRGEKLIDREVRMAAAKDRLIKSSLGALQEATSGSALDMTAAQQNSAPTVSSDSSRLDELERDTVGSKTLEGINGVLRPYPIQPQGAWGGYLIFDVPPALQKAKADQPVTIVVKTGSEVHRIPAVLNRI